MGIIYLRTISDFVRRSCSVRVICQACGHIEFLDPVILRRQLMQRKISLVNEAAAKRMRCKVCRQKRADIQPGRYY